MAVTLKHTRKVVVIGWDTEVVKGMHASMQVGGEEKRNVDNDGSANLYFPSSFTGDVEIVSRRVEVGHGLGHDLGNVEIRRGTLERRIS